MLDACVVIPAHNAAGTLPACLGALRAQRFPASRFEVIVVDDASTDGTGDIALSHGARLVRVQARSSASARNAGVAHAQAQWIASTDADCIPSAMWLASLLSAAARCPDCIGVAGTTLGHRSEHPAARFVDLTGGLNAERYLKHPLYPYAPMCNVMYRRSDLLAIGGFDPALATEGCDAAIRLRRLRAGSIELERRALVLHLHRDSWGAYFRQQCSYGRSHAALIRKLAPEAHWGLRDEARSWSRLLRRAVNPPLRSRRAGDDALIWKGQLVRDTAQRIGFASEFWLIPAWRHLTRREPGPATDVPATEARAGSEHA